MRDDDPDEEPNRLFMWAVLALFGAVMGLMLIR